MSNHIVLFEPLMPANTGNIARTCAGTDTILDLIEPLGFSVDDAHLKRAGLDYWDKVDIRYHKNLQAFMATVPDLDRLFLVSKFAEFAYTQRDYSTADQGDFYFMFGKETTGLPEPFMRQHEKQAIRIPQDDTHIRALNLSNSAAIVIYEVLRQQAFPGLELTHQYENDKLK
ncbi:rRNA methylase (SpoU class) [Secundilactobacillus odoratitofui DSM 19909 = JCM 15043]|uniref:Putative tRNA (cytidine(34)-2'-O)-methyltransferase n=1 Tax=Secundilactobacillus odoratitofui DSM 19909 = JCM 15043 TaxID=1423776 RepID=A0A0R1LZF6_9LACO|nr:tRNA (cytidine(34)-2'-O)-methyltransferase [Secundilactobacillus odoratitofui]KRK98313.1 rRNA methylase (SpoU class) [Secundilactobacillus odoratitofui DSM 19909 = JCM 15043]